MRLITQQDVKSINKWLVKQGHPETSWEVLPEKCIIIPGVAAGGLRYVEGGFYIMDSIVSNPLVSSGTRNRAMDRLFLTLSMWAQDCPIIGFSKEQGVIDRAKRHGFIPAVHTILTFNRNI